MRKYANDNYINVWRTEHMKKKPIIGISGSILLTEGGLFSGYRRSYVNQDYIESVIEAGGIPFIIPFNTDTSVTMEQIKNIDALILSGGHDVFPLIYGEEPKQNLGETFPERDYFDITLLKTSIELNKPILGICRGHQIINVGNGGTLYQDLSYDKELYIKHSQNTRWNIPTHKIIIEKGSFLEEIYEEGEGVVNSFHHQIINHIAKGFKVTARSKDGGIEAIEKIDDKSFIIGIQWHPEMMNISDNFSKKLFKKFINTVTER